MLPNNWVYDEATEEITDIIKTVNRLPIVDVFTSYGVKIEKISGRYAKALCPFHMDTRIGSFMINTDSNSCYCYSCNNGGNVVGSVAKILDVSYTKAALQIACDNKLIDKDKFKELLNIDYKPVAKKTKRHTKNSLEQLDKGIVALKNEVYEDMRQFFGLTKEHEKCLKEERHLTEDSLKNYFSIDTSSKSYLNHVKATFADKLDDIGNNVPGFYFDKKTVESIQVLRKKGIAIMIRDFEDNVTAIQVRDDDVNAKVRYTYLSFVPYSASGCFGGSSCGITFASVYSKDSDKLAIVEGMFKAEMLAANGFNAISVQGINNFSGIEREIEGMQQKGNFTAKTISVFYDADFVNNPQVTAAAIKLGEYLLAKLDVSVNYIIWDYNLGKGIDDLIISGNRRYCKSVDYETYRKHSEKSFTEALFITGFDKTPVSKLSKNDRDIILKEFSRLEGRIFNL